MAGILRPQNSHPTPMFNSPFSQMLPSHPTYSSLSRAFGSCFSLSLHLVKNLTLCGEKMDFVLDEEMGGRISSP